MSDETRNYWWLNADPAIWDYSTFSPGEEHGCTQVNEDGRPRKNQKCFPQVRPGDWVLGYSDSPKKQLSCLCKITRPLENGVFHFAKVLDFPNPVPSSGWTGEPVLKHFHFRGSLFKLSQEQWDGFVRLVEERNPGMTIPRIEDSRRVQILRALFAEMLLPKSKKWIGDWHDKYKLFCESVARAERIDDTLLYSLLRKRDNGVAVIGQSTLTKKFYAKLETSKEFRESLESFRKFSDKPHFSKMRDFVNRMASQAGHRKFPLRLNRIAVAFNRELSSFPNEAAFTQTLNWFMSNKLLDYHLAMDWFDDNLRLTKYFTEACSDIPGYDVWNRNMFLWWIYEEYARPNRPPPEPAMSIPATTLFHTTAMQQFNTIPVATHSLNTILYGPPGTGKTHDVVNHALAILGEQVSADYAVAKKRFDDLKDQGRVEFVTFHPSYGYEDFIEGIRPILCDGASGAVSYELHDGIFKAFCRRAQTSPISEESTDGGEWEEVPPLEVLRHANDVVWKVSLGGSLRKGRPAVKETRRIHDTCFEEGNMRIGWDIYGATPNERTQYLVEGQRVLEAFLHKAAIGDIVISLYTSTEIDGIGVIEGEYEWTGKSQTREKPLYERLNRVRRVRWIVKHVRIDIRAINGNKELSQATFYRTGISKADVVALAEKELGVPASSVVPADKPGSYVFIIDEINRGNISKIFGELITLVEPSKRLGAKEETRAVLPYSGEEFGVPQNVYILGTMNTADRSIALLDTALRRRFDFIEMMPRPELLPEQWPDGIDLRTMFRTMNERIEFLLDREHMIGHAYFMGEFAENPTMAGLAGIFRNRIVPLLQEYFFEDYGKIRLVLGDASKKEADQFVTEAKGLDKRLFPGVDSGFGGPVDEDRVVYRIQQEAFLRPEAYRGIYASPEAGKKAVE